MRAISAGTHTLWRRASGRVHRRLGLAISAALFLSLSSSGLVLADTDIGTTGVVGFHRLTDSMRKAGATCRYNPKYTGDYWYEGLIKYIDVRPPKVRASQPTQTVGWRFHVWRYRYNPSGPGGTWANTYTSPLQVDSTTPYQNAGFAPMSINVIVPRDGRQGNVAYDYWVQVEMFWYNGGGQVSGSSTHQVDYYKSQWNGWPGGTRTETDMYPCQAWVGVDI